MFFINLGNIEKEKYMFSFNNLGNIEEDFTHKSKSEGCSSSLQAHQETTMLSLSLHSQLSHFRESHSCKNA